MLYLFERQRRRYALLNDERVKRLLFDGNCEQRLANHVRACSKLRKGGYSTVVRWDEYSVLKVSPFSTDEDAFVFTQSHYRSECSQLLIHNLLWNTCVVSQHTPHIVMPYADRTLNSKTLQFIEYANFGDATAYFKRVSHKMLDGECRFFFFQVCWTLCAIYRSYRNFRHNDLKCHNVFLTNTREVNRYFYKSFDGKIFAPRLSSDKRCFMALIGDFDFAAICGTVENYKTLIMETELPTLNLNNTANHTSDMYLCVKTFCSAFSHRLSDELKSELLQFYDEEILRVNPDDGNYCRQSAFSKHKMPTAYEFLNSSFFAQYLVDEPKNMNPTNTFRIPVAEVGEMGKFCLLGIRHREVAHVPFFMARPQYMKILPLAPRSYTTLPNVQICTEGNLMEQSGMERARDFFSEYMKLDSDEWLYDAQTFTHQHYVPHRYWALVCWASLVHHSRYCSSIPIAQVMRDHLEWWEILEPTLGKVVDGVGALVHMQLQFNWYKL